MRDRLRKKAQELADLSRKKAAQMADIRKEKTGVVVEPMGRQAAETAVHPVKQNVFGNDKTA